MTDLNIPFRMAFVLACLLAGFVFWPAFILAAIVALLIVDDVRNEPARRAESARIAARANPSVTPTEMREECESPAETAFLEAMTKAYGLTAGPGALEGGGLRLEAQVGLGRLIIGRGSAWSQYRADFVVDQRLVVEIDGAAWHSSDAAVARDASRDADLRREGYAVLRIPAKPVFAQPQEAVRMVEQARAALRDGGASRAVAGDAARSASPPAQRPGAGAGRAVADAVGVAATALSRLSEKVDRACERSDLHVIVRHFLGRIEAVMDAAGRHVEKTAVLRASLGTDMDAAARVAAFKDIVARIAEAFSEDSEAVRLDPLRALIRKTPDTDRARAVFEEEADAAVDAHLARIADVHDAVFPGQPLFVRGTDAGKACIVEQIRAAVFEGADPGTFIHPYHPPLTIGPAKLRIIWTPWTTMVARLRKPEGLEGAFYMHL